jgi:phage-related protein
VGRTAYNHADKRDVPEKIIATNGFVKKTQKTPPKELKLAKERRADWLERHKEVRDDT